MKKLLLLILCILCSYNAESQIKLKPTWTTGMGFAGKPIFFNKAATRMLTTSLNGVSYWNLVAGEVIYVIPYTTTDRGGIAVNKDFTLFALVVRPIAGTGMIIKVFDIATGDNVANFSYPEYLSATYLTFNNSSDKLAMGTEKGDVIVWDLKEEKLVCSVVKLGEITDIAFIGQTNTIVAADTYGNLKRINIDNCSLIDLVQKSKNYAETDISTEGQRALISYSSTTDGKPFNVVINTIDGSNVSIPEELSRDWSRYAKLSHDGTKIALVQDSLNKFALVKIGDLSTGKIILNKTSQSEPNFIFYTQGKINAEFNEVGDKFILSGMNGISAMYDLKVGSVVSFEGKHRQWHSVFFADNSNKVVTYSDDGMIIEWSMETQKALRYFWGTPFNDLRPIDITSDEKYVVTRGVNGPIALIDKKTGKLQNFLLSSPWVPANLGSDIIPCKDPSKIMLYDGHKSAKKLDIITGETLLQMESDNKSDTIYKWNVPRNNHAFYSEDNNQIVVAFGAQTNVHNATTGALLFSMKGHLGSPFLGEYYEKYTDFVYASKFNKIMTGGTDDKLRVWSATTGELLNTFDASSFHRSLAFCKNQDIILIGDLLKREIYKWDLSTMSLMKTFAPIKIDADRAFTSDLDISGEESLLATSTRDEFCVMDFNSGDVLLRDTLPVWIDKVKFSNKSDLVAVGGSDGEIYIYNLHDGTVKFELIGHNGRIYYMKFCDNDSTLLTGSGDGTIKLWNFMENNETSAKADIQNKIQMRYTNPSQNELQLFTGQPLSHDVEYSIINSLGIRVFSGFLKSGSEKYTIPLHSLQRGLFFLQTNINGTIQHNKFLISD